MVQIDWNRVLDIGLPQIDEQHKKLLSIADDLLQATIQNRGEDELTTVFNELKSYTDSHFADEERYMLAIGYPHEVEHALLHKLLARRVDDFRDRLLYSKVTPDEALDFINNWIVTHIAEEDSRIGEFAKTSQHTSTQDSQE